MSRLFNKLGTYRRSKECSLLPEPPSLLQQLPFSRRSLVAVLSSSFNPIKSGATAEFQVDYSLNYAKSSAGLGRTPD